MKGDFFKHLLGGMKKPTPKARDSLRLQGYDYSWEGYYFITICTKNRLNHFGKIVKGEMLPSKAGSIVVEEWKKTPTIRESSEILLDEFCLMPNHFHAIIQLGDPIVPGKSRRVPYTDGTLNRFGKQSKNLSAIVGGFKAACTKRIRAINPRFEWQSRFYDHIIRDLKSLDNIRYYIKENPGNWEKDEFR